VTGGSKIVDWVHAHSDAKIALSTRARRREGFDRVAWEASTALEEGNWR